ncbi:hypothetical protein ACWEIM_15895 [Streptomyces sp. NPDC004778]
MGQLAHLLHSGPTWTDLGLHGVLYAAFWITWAGFVVYGDIAAAATRTSALLAAMLGMAVMAAAGHRRRRHSDRPGRRLRDRLRRAALVRRTSLDQGQHRHRLAPGPGRHRSRALAGFTLHRRPLALPIVVVRYPRGPRRIVRVLPQPRIAPSPDPPRPRVRARPPPTHR